MWCGIERSLKSGRYRVVVPMDSKSIDSNMMTKFTGKILTKWFDDLEDAKMACREFNALHDKYN